MFYQETFINGVLMFRTTPNGDWQPCSIEQINQRIVELKAEIKALKMADNNDSCGKIKRVHAVQIISKLLKMAGEKFSNHGCNDLPDSFFDDMSQKERQAFYKQYHEWNGDPEDYDLNQIGYLGDSALMHFFSDYVKEM